MSEVRRLSQHQALLALVVILVAAFGLRVWELQRPSLWHDEGWSLRPLRDPLTPPFAGVSPPLDRLIPSLQVPGFAYHYRNNTPPLYYVVLHLLWGPAGESEFALRYPGVLIDLLTVTIGARLLWRWAGPGAGLAGAALLGTSPLLWAYAREFRPYMAVPFFAVLLLWLADRLLRAGERFPWRTWVPTLAVVWALLWTHNLSVTLVGWLNSVVVVAWGWRRRWRWLGLWTAGQLLLLLSYVPWLAGQAPSGTALNTTPRIALEQFWDLWQGYTAPLPWMVGAEDRLVLGSLVLGALALLALAIVLIRDRRRAALLVATQAVLLPVLSTLEMLSAHIDFHPRYTISGVAAALMLLVLGAAALRRPAMLRRGALAGVTLTGCAVGLLGILALKDTPRYQHDDFRALSAYYAALPAETLIVLPYEREPALQDYYAQRMGMQAQVLGLWLYTDADSVIAQINAALAERPLPRPVELANWFQLPADLRGLYPCALESAGAWQGERLMQGLGTTAYRIERPIAFAPVEAQADYGAIALTGAARAGIDTLCLRTEWTLARDTDQDWRVSVRLVTTDLPGLVVARSDSDIRNVKEEPTSLWDVDDSGLAFSRLRFPAGAPPGTYALQMVVFSAEELSGIDRLVEGVPSGRVLALEPVTLPHVAAGAVPDLAQVSDVAVAEGIVLRSHDAAGGLLDAGTDLPVTLHWQIAADCCTREPWSAATLLLQGEGWQVAEPVRAYGPASLDWHALRVPAEASGLATLSLIATGNAPIPLARYTVAQTDRLMAPPPVAIPVGTELGGVAVLEGFDVTPLALSTDQTLALTLVWRALNTPELSYRVFTHLLDAEGRVIAQHDGYPVAETRPMTGWVTGEYLIDAHTLAFDPRSLDYRGPARLEVGFYDPATNQRLLAANGADHVLLPVTIEVQ